MMKVNCCVFTEPGFESTAIKELKEIIDEKHTKQESGVVFFNSSLENLCKFTYFSQISKRIIVLLSEFEVFEDLEETKKSFEKSSLTQYSDEFNTFFMTSNRVGTHNFSRHDAEKELSSLLNNKLSDKTDNKENIFLNIVNNKGYLGLDVAGFDLDKRDYRISISPSEIKPTFYYHLFRLAEFTGGKFLDPFVLSGTLLIEGALSSSGVSHNFFRKEDFNFLKSKFFSQINFENFFDFPNKENKSYFFGFSKKKNYLISSNKNAVVANVQNLINFQHLETRVFPEKDFNAIVSHLPSVSKTFPKKLFVSFLSKLLVEIQNSRADKSVVVLATSSPEEFESCCKEANINCEVLQIVTASKREVHIFKLV